MGTKEKHEEDKKQNKLAQVRREYVWGDIINEFKHSKNRLIREEYNIRLRIAEEKWRKLFRQLKEDNKLGSL